jgi:hypothetical protein
VVKYLLSFLLVCNFLYAEEKNLLEEVIVIDDPLTTKIKSFLEEKKYTENEAFINVIFEPKTAFYENDRVNSVKVIQTLKENGLLKLFYNKPQAIRLNFKTSGSPLFFVKIMGDTLRNIGYYRYVTLASDLDSSEFVWNISLTSEYVTDPIILEKELQKSACKIIDIERITPTEWTYVIDMGRGFLNVKKLYAEQNISLKRSQYAHWLDISKIKNLHISSSKRNSWYPYIAYYDASLHLLKVLKKDKITYEVSLRIPPNTKYIKLSDIYNMKNIRDELRLIPTHSK